MSTRWGRKETVIWPPRKPIHTWGAAFLALILTGAFCYIHYSWALTPLERLYLPTYLRATLVPSFRPTAKYRILLVTDDDGDVQYATESDVQDGATPEPNGKALPLALSDRARQSGLHNLCVSTPLMLQTKPLRDYLDRTVYGGQKPWTLFAWPVLFGLLSFSLQLPFSVSKDIRRFRELKYGRRLKGPVMVTPRQFNREFRGTGVGIKTDDCPQMLRIPAQAEDQHIEIIGDTGSGKTTVLCAIRGAAELQGYEVRGFAPTSRAARQLNDAGVRAGTLQGFLAQSRQESSPDQRRFFFVDESSLASTKQMGNFLERLNPSDRVLLIGDTRQHRGVEAGRPFEQLQQAGMRTAHLDEIVRQKDPALKAAVELLSQGQTAAGIELLNQQGRIREIPERGERIRTVARLYAESPLNTLIVAPDNASRRDLNIAARHELKANGTVMPEDHSFRVLVQRQDMTGADRSWANRYEIGDVVRYARGSKDVGIGADSYGTVAAINATANLLTIEKQSGEFATYDPRRLTGVSVYREVTHEFSVGDRIQFTAADKALGVANRDLAVIESVTPGGRVVARGDDNRRLEFNAVEHRHFDHGYAVTSHSAQGLTAQRVLIHADTSVHPDLLTSRFGYVAVSRASREASIFTDDLPRLVQQIGAEVSKTSALEIAPQTLLPQDQSVGMGLG